MRGFNRHSHLLLAIGLILIPLSGCGIGGDRTDFTAGANRSCQRTTINLQRLENDQSNKGKLAHVIDVYGETDRLVSELREMSLPKPDAQALEMRWLKPAQHDLAAIHNRLPGIRGQSDNPDLKQISAEENALSHLGGSAVDNAFLASYGLTDCQQLFGEH